MTKLTTLQPHPLSDRVYRAIRSVCDSEDFLPLHEPRFAGNEWNFVKDCLDTGWVSTAGKYVESFEDRLADYTEIPHAVAVVNGTSALHTCLLLAGVEPDDEVIMPAITFVATANAVAYAGATPHFADLDPASLGFSIEKLRSHLKQETIHRNGRLFNRQTDRPIAAIVAVHLLGHMGNMTDLVELCEEFGVTLIEDAAEALGSSSDGIHAGGFGRLSALSFNGNKIITCGGGGAILTRDEKLASAARHLTTTGRVAHRWEFIHDTVAFNYRMPNINAALGCGQLEQLDGYLERKRALHGLYEVALSAIDGVTLFEGSSNCKANYWLNSIVLDDDLAAHRDELLAVTNERGVMTRPLWTPMHRLPMYTACPRMDLSEAESLYQRIIAIPSSPHLTGNTSP